MVSVVLESLKKVRSVELEQSEAGWAARSQAERDEVLRGMRDDENKLKFYLPLCNETINMISFLSSDIQIRSKFMLPVLLPRLADMLLSIIARLVGPKGLEIKVSNMELYSFRPRDMLRELFGIICFYSGDVLFQEKVATCGFYEAYPNALPLAVNTIRRHQLLPEGSLRQLDALVVATKAAAKLQADDETPPDRFLCELMCELMDDPVALPGSHVVERASIEQHLLNDPTNPYTRQPLTVIELIPMTELKAEIEEWKASRTQRAREKQLPVLDAPSSL